MPDADDFDVEYFKKMLHGGGDKPQPKAAAPAKQSRAAGAKNKTAPTTAKKPKPRRKP